MTERFSTWNLKLVAVLAALLLSSLTTAVAFATPPLFDDDFQTGIQSSAWGLYPIGGACWEPLAEGNNGMIRSPAQPFPVWPEPRQDNILTTRDDFGDFVATWDMRFHTEGWDQDYRLVYLRCDDAATPHGYVITIGVSVPPIGNRDVLAIGVGRPDGSSETFASMDHPWDLAAWYRFKARLAGNQIDLKVWRLGDPEPSGWTIETQDPSATFLHGRIGFGDYWRSITDVDNVAVSSATATVPDLPLRNPQIPLNGSVLQQYLNGVGETINVYADQIAAQVCSTSVSGNSTFSLMIELAGNANQNTYGVYDATLPAPPLYEVFPGHAAAGWYAIVSFLATGDLVVNLFDATGNLVGHTVHPGVSAARVGFYLRGPGGTFHSEDARNGGDAQALLYAGTGRNWGDLWLCWEDIAFVPSDRDFNDGVLLLQSLAPVAGRSSSWGALKVRYR